MGIHLDMDAPDRSLCHMDCDNNDSSSDDDSIFVDLLRDLQDRGIDLCWV
jgi:hypothetical protein